MQFVRTVSAECHEGDDGWTVRHIYWVGVGAQGQKLRCTAFYTVVNELAGQHLVEALTPDD